MYRCSSSNANAARVPSAIALCMAAASGLPALSLWSRSIASLQPKSDPRSPAVVVSGSGIASCQQASSSLPSRYGRFVDRRQAATGLGDVRLTGPIEEPRFQAARIRATGRPREPPSVRRVGAVVSVMYCKSHRCDSSALAKLPAGSRQAEIGRHVASEQVAMRSQPRSRSRERLRTICGRIRVRFPSGGAWFERFPAVAAACPS